MNHGLLSFVAKKELRICNKIPEEERSKIFKMDI